MQAQQLYEFGPYRLSTAEHLLMRAGEVVPLTPKVFDVLALLVERNGHLLEREMLLSTVWADRFVEEANLTVSISTLRKVLGEQADGRPYIETMPKRGYRFVADVRVIKDEPEDLMLREQTGAPGIIEPDEEKDDQNEAASEEPAHAQEQAKAPASRRVRWQALMAGAMMIVILAGGTYWWKTVREKPARADAPIHSIAVLPFRQMGEGKKDELAGFGMADVLITKLGSLNRITVRPTSAVFKYIDTEPDIGSVSRELNVDALIEGSIQRIGERIRVTVSLVRVRDGELLWAETFDGRFNDQFTIQDKMSERLGTVLSLSPADEQKKMLTKRYTDNPEAYRAYLKGRYLWNRRTATDLVKAIEYFERAIAIDASYALAYAGLADAYALLGDYGVVAAKEVFPKMKVAAIRAVELDDQLAETHTSLAYAKRLADWDWPGAEQEFQRALDLNSSYATAHHWYSEYLAGMGRFDEALAEAKRAQELDPQSIIINTNIGWILYLARRYDEAIEELQKSLEMDPTFFLAQELIWQSYVQKGVYKEALAWEDMSILARPPEWRARDALLRKAYETAGWKGFERKVLELELERQKKKKGLKVNVVASHIARLYATVGEKDLAFKWFQKAFEDRDAYMVWLKIDPALGDDLRADPRFIELLRHMRLEP
jgi:DNA-binding winged helix-turn-helix (wHTH) protein/TolB-like protein